MLAGDFVVDLRGYFRIGGGEGGIQIDRHTFHLMPALCQPKTASAQKLRQHARVRRL